MYHIVYISICYYKFTCHVSKCNTFHTTILTNRIFFVKIAISYYHKMSLLCNLLMNPPVLYCLNKLFMIYYTFILLKLPPNSRKAALWLSQLCYYTLLFSLCIICCSLLGETNVLLLILVALWFVFR